MPLVLAVGEPATGRSFTTDRVVLRTHGFKLASAAILFAVLALGIFEGVLPLHFAERLDQSEIAAVYVAAALIVAGSAAAAGNVRPRRLVVAAVGLATAGITLAGAGGEVPLWLLALLVAAVGIGIGNTGSIGVLVETVPVERIVTPMVIWSQIGIAGYLLGGVVAEQLGYAYLGVVPALAGMLVLTLVVGPRLVCHAKQASAAGSDRPARSGALRLVALVAQPEARQGLIQAGECWEGVAEPGEYEHPPNRRVGPDERQVAACLQHLTQAANEHRQHHRVQKADPSEVDDQLRFAGTHRVIERLLELRRVRRVEVSVEHEHLRPVAGWLGATRALVGH